MTEYPGFMVYFDSWGPLMMTGDATLAAILRAAMRYAETGEPPALKGKAAVLWEMVRPKLDRDRLKYEEARVKKRYAVYCREAGKNGGRPLSYAEWLRATSPDAERYPNTDTDTNTDATPTPTPDPNTNPSPYTDPYPAPTSEAVTAPKADPAAEASRAGERLRGAAGDLSLEECRRLFGLGKP